MDWRQSRSASSRPREGAPRISPMLQATPAGKSWFRSACVGRKFGQSFSAGILVRDFSGMGRTPASRYFAAASRAMVGKLRPLTSTEESVIVTVSFRQDEGSKRSFRQDEGQKVLSPGRGSRGPFVGRRGEPPPR